MLIDIEELAEKYCGEERAVIWKINLNYQSPPPPPLPPESPPPKSYEEVLVSQI